jgi:hypothetical protein
MRVLAMVEDRVVLGRGIRRGYMMGRLEGLI